MSISRLIAEQSFFHSYQPVCNLNNDSKLGYEALLRSDDYSNPELVFEAARKADELFELDCASIYKAILDCRARGMNNENLFVNIFPSTIMNPAFSTFISQITEGQLTNEQLTFEIIEAEDIQDFESFRSRIKMLREKGFFIALDDVGKGYSGLQRMIELQPEYLKVDAYFTRNIHHSRDKQSVVLSLLQYCKDRNIVLILEGIEGGVNNFV